MQLKLGNRAVEALKASRDPYEVRDSELSGLLVRVQPSGVMTYYVDYRNIRRQRKRVKLGRVGVISSAQARDMALEVLGDVAKGNDPAEKKKTTRLITFGNYITTTYAPWAAANFHHPNKTIAGLRSAYADFLDMQLDDITAWKVERWIVDRKKLGISPATINRQVGMLKASLARAVKWQILTVNPLSAIKAQRLDKNVKVRFLSDEEEHHLMIALHNREQRRREERNSGNSWRKKRGIEPLEVTCSSDFSDHLFPMVLISLNTGMRRGELFSLTWNNVDLVRQIITVEGACAKSGQTRHIPMNATVLEVFRKLSKSAKSDLIFVGRDGGMFDNVKRSWMRVLKEANINTFRWHDMRHHFASRLVQRGVDLNTVRVLLGHKDLKMTLRYAHLSPQVMAEAVSRLV